MENRARTPRQSHWHAPCTDTKPLPPPHTLQHTTHPAPAVSSHPHASPGLRVLWTPHTSVSANLCSLSLHTPLAKACQDVSTGTYIVPNSMFSFRREREREEGVEPGWGSWSSGDRSKGASVWGWIWGVGWGDKPVRCRGASPNPAGARGPRVHLSSYYCNKSELYYMKGKMNYRR